MGLGVAKIFAAASIHVRLCDASLKLSWQGREQLVEWGVYSEEEEERDRLLLERDRCYAALNELLERLPPVEVEQEEDTL